MEVNQYFYSLAKISAQKSWRHFTDFIDFANYFGNYLTYYREDGMTNATSLYSYINALYNGGYFTADFNSYYGSVLQVFNTINF